VVLGPHSIFMLFVKFRRNIDLNPLLPSDKHFQSSRMALHATRIVELGNGLKFWFLRCSCPIFRVDFFGGSMRE